MARIFVNVMPKEEILDPQGQAVVRALGRIGISGVSDVRQGKRFQLDVDADVTRENVEHIASQLLANTVVEEFEIVGFEVEDSAAGSGTAGQSAAGEVAAQ